MNKKKITSTLMAVALVSSLALGSLAWFTSQDSVTNPFSTASTVDDKLNAGIEINETFNPETAKNITPGENVEKIVKVKSTAEYDQFVRAKITKEFTRTYKNGDGSSKTEIVNAYKVNDDNTITYSNQTDLTKLPEGVKPLNLEYIKYEPNNIDWSNSKDENNIDYYYYNEVLEKGALTKPLINEVVLSKEADNVYKNLGFNVIVDAESIQAANKAANEAWSTSPVKFKTMVTEYEDGNTANEKKGAEAIEKEKNDAKVQAAKAE